ncbi:MAG: hypothetical protein ACLFVP_06150 [Candidatus Bathyarchaeia archaeon]
MDDERVEDSSSSEIVDIPSRNFKNMVIFWAEELCNIEEGIHPYEAGLSALITRKLRGRGVLRYNWNGAERIWKVSSKALEVLEGVDG